MNTYMDRHAALTVDLGEGVYLLFPLDLGLGRGGVDTAEINETLEVEIKAEELEGEDFGSDGEAKEGGEDESGREALEEKLGEGVIPNVGGGKVLERI
ncbi:hypothetical protein JHK84_043585 [Glycine max]|nr:hypothetical protein JHK84_043585 [Glycine max]